MSDDQTLPTLASEIQKVNPELLENAMIEKEKQQQNPMGNPEDLAAAFFQKNFPRIKYLMKNLSKRAIERAVVCASAYPLVPGGYKPKDKAETELAWAIEQMVACKVMMIEAMKLQKLESIDQLTENNESLTKGEPENVTSTSET